MRWFDGTDWVVASKADLKAIAQGIDESQRRAIESQSGRGKVRALELLWAQTVEEVHGIKVPSFTDRERGYVSDLAEKYGGEEAKALILKSIQRWTDLYMEESLHKVLTPTPVFGTFYAFREKIRAFVFHFAKKEEKRTETTVKLKKMEKEAEPERGKKPAIPLSEMVKQARQQLQKEKR